MKVKNVIMPVMAFVIAIGMAFATTPINGFQTEVWMKEHPTSPCLTTTCVRSGVVPCGEASPLYSDDICEDAIEEAFIRPI